MTDTVFIVEFSEQGMGSHILGVAASLKLAREAALAYIAKVGSADWVEHAAHNWSSYGDRVRVVSHPVVGVPQCPVKFLRERLKGRVVFHSVRVAQQFPAGSHLRVAGYLHDVVEDGGATLAEVRELFGPVVADIVDGVTRREDELYRDFIYRAAGDLSSRVVKAADVRDNLRDLPPEKESLRKRYERALAVLTAVM